MSTRTSKGFLAGSTRDRTQFVNPKTGLATKRDTTTGKFKAVKKTGGLFKNVAQERDLRRR